MAPSSIRCAYFECKFSRNNRSDLSFFRFPTDKHRKYKWLINCGNASLFRLSSEQLYEKRICATHFEANQFSNYIKNRLIFNAVPLHYLSIDEPVFPESFKITKEAVPKVYSKVIRFETEDCVPILPAVKNDDASDLLESPTALIQREMDFQVKKTTKEQFQKMLEFVKNNEIVVRAKGTLSEVETVRNLWQEFATDVNSLDYGPKKNAKEWRHVFNEWKMNVKRKRRKLLQSKPGENVTYRTGLSELEKGLLQLLNIDHNETQDPLLLPSSASNTSTCSEQFHQCNDEFAGSSSCETSDNMQSHLDTMKIEIVDEMHPIKEWLYSPKTEVEKSPDRFASNSLKEACEQFVHEQDLGIELEQARAESLGVLNSTLTALVKVQKEWAATEKERAVTEKGKLKLKYFEIYKTFQGFDEFYYNL